jgi:hypothetical protein
LIRQAISCDICATEKKLTIHWFVAFEQGGELRLSGWNSRNRLRPGMKHLCGQTCLHKLVDEFMARTIEVRTPASLAEESVECASLATDTSLTLTAAYEAVTSPGREVTPAAPPPVLPKRIPPKAHAGIVAMPGRHQVQEPAIPADAPRFTSRTWRAEAWDRERERELRGVERQPDTGARRRSGS